MSIGIIGVNHVNVTVPAALEQAAKHFYGAVLGLRQIPKPEGTRQNMGAWYDLGAGLQLHLSIEDNVQNEASDRHVCYQVPDAAGAEEFCILLPQTSLSEAGVIAERMRQKVTETDNVWSGSVPQSNVLPDSGDSTDLLMDQ